ncbi:MAG: tRNA pseudouridine(38-40) synthase TruA [Flavobacterium psychrophilum]
MRYFIQFSYNGTQYHGWQIQPNALSVQEVLTQALQTILGTAVELTGAGRTDAGVHAKQMFAHVDLLQEIESEKLVYKLNAFLPKDIAVSNIFPVSNEAHVRFDATKRTYEYHIHTQKNPFLEQLSWYVQQTVDVPLMNEAAKKLLLHTDFQCFSKVNTDVATFDCKIYEASWTLENQQLVFTISADRFLRNMVRAIVGTLINVGLHKTTLAEFEQIIVGKNRSDAGFSVPAHGLFLTAIAYPYLPNLPDIAP